MDFIRTGCDRMYNVESCALGLDELNPVVSPLKVQDGLLANVLGCAFHDEPNSIYDLPARRDHY